MCTIENGNVFCVSDTHGYSFEKIIGLLDKVGFNNNDLLYVLGDTVDRGNGEDMRLFIHYIMSRSNVRLILGNHEKLVLNSTCLLEEPRKTIGELTVSEDRSYRLWMANGGEPTLEMFQKISVSEADRILELFREAPLYEEVFIGEKRFVLCHSGLGGYSSDKPLEQYSERELLWYRPELNERFWLNDNTTIVFGHTPTMYIDENNQGQPIFSSTWINIDT